MNYDKIQTVHSNNVAILVIIDILGDPCENHGICIPGNPKSCVCLKGFTGELCETNVDECLDNQCQNGGNVLFFDISVNRTTVNTFLFVGMKFQDFFEKPQFRGHLNLWN